jgi:hypothetical protein
MIIILQTKKIMKIKSIRQCRKQHNRRIVICTFTLRREGKTINNKVLTVKPIITMVIIAIDYILIKQEIYAYFFITAHNYSDSIS